MATAKPLSPRHTLEAQDTKNPRLDAEGFYESKILFSVPNCLVCQSRNGDKHQERINTPPYRFGKQRLLEKRLINENA